MEVVEQPAVDLPESSAASTAVTPEAQTPAAQVEGGEQPGLLGEVSAESPDEDLEEIEHEGKKAKVPKEWKDSFLRQQDYTRKTQEVAEQRRAVEGRAQAIEQAAQLRDATLNERAQLIAIDQRLKQYEQVNWREAIQQNPQAAQEAQVDMMNLRDQRARVEQGIAQKHQALAFHQQQFAVKQMEEGRRELERDIKGWSPELAQKLMQTAKSLGFRDEELTNVSDPRTVKLLHEAYMYRQSLTKPVPKPAAAPLPKPVTKVGGGGATNAKPLSDLSPEEWAARRNEKRFEKRR